MSKTWKIVLAVVAAVMLLTLGATAVLAQDEAAQPEATGVRGLLARVAQILNIPETDLVNAFQQAKQELREEKQARLEERWQGWWEQSQEKALAALERAVANEVITQDEADEIIAWWQDSPEAVDTLSEYAFTHRIKVGLFLRDTAGEGWLERMQAVLDRAVANDIIAQGEADDIVAWWQDRPEALSKLVQPLTNRLTRLWKQRIEHRDRDNRVPEPTATTTI